MIITAKDLLNSKEYKSFGMEFIKKYYANGLHEIDWKDIEEIIIFDIDEFNKFQSFCRYFKINLKVKYKGGSNYWETYKYDEAGREIQYKNSQDCHEEWEYNKNGDLVKHKDYKYGEYTIIKYNKEGKIIERIRKFQQRPIEKEVFKYNKNGQMISWKQPNYHNQKWEYNEAGEMIGHEISGYMHKTISDGGYEIEIYNPGRSIKINKDGAVDLDGAGNYRTGIVVLEKE